MPNSHKLGVYLAPTHDPEKWKNYLFTIDPAWVRILMPGDSPTSLVSDVHKVCPKADISLRWWDLDDGGAEKYSRLAHPEGAVDNAREMVRRVEEMEVQAGREKLPFPVRGQLWFNGLNEPPSWEHDKRDHIVQWNVNGAREASKFGFGWMHYEAAVGHPEEWPPVWEWAEPMFEAIEKYDGVLALHEYWQPEGPFYEWRDEDEQVRQDWGALAGRYTHLSSTVPIVITETGCDGRIYNRHATPDTGYLKFMNAEKYATQMEAYLREVKKDSRIQAVLPFLTDFKDDEWASFDTLHAKDAFYAMYSRLDEEDEETPAPVTVRLPAVHNPGSDVVVTPDPSSGTPVTLSGVVDPYVARAILQVESGGRGRNPDGSLKIRFEAHIFERYVPKVRFDAHFRYDPNDILSAWYRENIFGGWLPIHANQDSEWKAFRIAAAIGGSAPTKNAAMMSISMGAAQIMGFNHARVGFATPEAMFKAFEEDDIYHLIAFFNFVLGSEELLKAVVAKDWREIARLYNGTLLVDLYSARLEQAYKKLTENGNAE